MPAEAAVVPGHEAVLTDDVELKDAAIVAKSTCSGSSSAKAPIQEFYPFPFFIPPYYPPYDEIVPAVEADEPAHPTVPNVADVVKPDND